MSSGVDVFVYPVAAVIFLNLYRPFIFDIETKDYMFYLSTPYLLTFYLLSFFLFGWTIYLSETIDNDDIYYVSIFLTVSNILWGMSYKDYRRVTVFLLFASLLLGYINYNEIFLSSLTDNGNTLYLNLYSGYLIWIGFMIAVTIEKFRNLKRLN